MKLKRLAAILLSTSLIVSNTGNVLAAALNIPLELNLRMIDGEINGGDNYELVNNSERDIRINSITLKGLGNWQVIGYNKIGNTVKDDKKVSMLVNGVGIDDTGRVDLGDLIIRGNSSLPVNIEMLIPHQTGLMDSTGIAVIEYDYDEIIESNATNDWRGDAVLVNTQHTVTIDSTDNSDDAIFIKDINISNPDIVEVNQTLTVGTIELLIETKGNGESDVDITLSNGAKTSFKVETFSIDTPKIENGLDAIKDNNNSIQIGDTISTGDIYIDLPILDKDLEENQIRVYPEFEDIIVSDKETIINGIVNIDGEEIPVQIKVNPVERSEISYTLDEDTVMVGDSTDLSITVSSVSGTEGIDRIEYSEAGIVEIIPTEVNNLSLIDNTLNFKINGLNLGKTTVKAYLNNGDNISFDITTSEIGDISNLISSDTFIEGDTIQTGDITLDIPLLVGDTSEVIQVQPVFNEIDLVNGENIITGIITIGNKEIPIEFKVIADEFPSGTLSKSLMDTQLKSLTGSISFVNEIYKGSEDTVDISNEQNGSILVVKDGQDAVVYSAKPIELTTGSELFSEYQCSSLDLRGLDTSKVTTMYKMFNNCKQLTNLNISSFNTSEVTNMSYMFNWCEKLTDLDVSHFITDKVTNMSWMFGYCKLLTVLDVSNFNTSEVTDMSRMFLYCEKLTQLDISNFNTSKVTDMNRMFFYCQSLTDLDVSNFITDKVTDMSYMFCWCKLVTELDVSNFNTSKVTNMTGMFNSCESVEQLDVSGFDTRNVVDISAMFYGCSAITDIDVSNFNVSNVTSNHGSSIFEGCSSLVSVNINSWNFLNCSNPHSMFENCTSLEFVDLSNVNLYKCGIDDMFKNCTSLKKVIIGAINTKGTNTYLDISEAFYSCTSLEYVDISKFTVGILDDDTDYASFSYQTFFNVPSTCKVYVSSSKLSEWNSVKSIMQFNGTFIAK